MLTNTLAQIRKKDITEAAQLEWEQKKREKKEAAKLRKRKRTSAVSSHASPAAQRPKKKQQRNLQEFVVEDSIEQVSEYQPTQALTDWSIPSSSEAASSPVRSPRIRLPPPGFILPEFDDPIEFTQSSSSQRIAAVVIVVPRNFDRSRHITPTPGPPHPPSRSRSPSPPLPVLVHSQSEDHPIIPPTRSPSPQYSPALPPSPIALSPRSRTPSASPLAPPQSPLRLSLEESEEERLAPFPRFRLSQVIPDSQDLFGTPISLVLLPTQPSTPSGETPSEEAPSELSSFECPEFPRSPSAETPPSSSYEEPPPNFDSQVVPANSQSQSVSQKTIPSQDATAQTETRTTLVCSPRRPPVTSQGSSTLSSSAFLAQLQRIKEESLNPSPAQPRQTFGQGLGHFFRIEKRLNEEDVIQETYLEAQLYLEMSENMSSPTAAQALRQRQAERKRLMEQSTVRRDSIGSVAETTPSRNLPLRSPSIGTQESTSLPTPPRVMQPEAQPTQNFVQSEAQSGTQLPQSTTQEQDVFGRPNLGPDEWAIGLPLNDMEIAANAVHTQKSIHLHYVNQQHNDIENYLSGKTGASAALKIITEISRITVHPNLAYPLPEVQASDEGWTSLHVRSSSKFKFLYALVDALKEDQVKIGIIAQESMLIDLLEALFRGMRVHTNRYDRPSTLPPLPEDEIESMVSIYIIPSKNSNAVGIYCNLVIAMDSWFDAEHPEVCDMRKDLYVPGKKAPVLRLVSLNTIEHALICTDQSKEILKPCVEAIKILRNEAGNADPAYLSAVQSAPETIAAWIRNSSVGPLNIPPLPELSLFETAAATQVAGTQVTETQMTAPATASSPDNGEKRKRRVCAQN